MGWGGVGWGGGMRGRSQYKICLFTRRSKQNVIVTRCSSQGHCSDDRLVHKVKEGSP